MLRKKNKRKRQWRKRFWAVFLLALCLSVGLHLRLYDVLGHVKNLLASRQPAPSQPSEVEFLTIDQPVPPDVSPAPADRAQPKQQPKALAKPEKPAELKKPKEKEEEKKKEELAAKPPEQDLSRAQAIKQKSKDPNVEAPKNAQYMAKENQRVEEETVARSRSYDRDDAEPDMTPPPGAKESPTHAEGEEDAKPQKPQVAQQPAAEPPKSAVPAKPAAESGPAGSAPAKSAQAPSKAAPASPKEQAPQVIRDPFGTFTVGPGRPSTPSSPAKDAMAGAQGQKAKLGLSWGQFEQTFGEGELRKEREQYEAARKQKRAMLAGGKHPKRWKEFRAAIENFVPHVKPGNQTALNAAASPFADYLTAVHLRIHRLYADDYLPSIPAGPNRFNDPALRTKLEIIVNGDGSIYRVGIVESSGLMLFDYGAFSSVVNAQPFPVPPKNILSGDGRVYFRWGFYRSERQCGTFNAEAYILPNPKEPKFEPPNDRLGDASSSTLCGAQAC